MRDKFCSTYRDLTTRHREGALAYAVLLLHAGNLAVDNDSWIEPPNAACAVRSPFSDLECLLYLPLEPGTGVGHILRRRAASLALTHYLREGIFTQKLTGDTFPLDTAVSLLASPAIKRCIDEDGQLLHDLAELEAASEPLS